MAYDRRNGPWNADQTGSELVDLLDEDDREALARVNWAALRFTLDALKEAPVEDHAMLLAHARREAKGDPEALALVEAAIGPTPRTLREVHAELEAHVFAGTLTEAVYSRLLEEERAQSPGGVLECGTTWLDARERAGLTSGE